MKYGFVRLRNDDGSAAYMEVEQFDRYRNHDVFKSHAESLVVYDKIYIGCFPLIFKEDEIIEFNSDAVIDVELPMTDISFCRSIPSSVAKSLGCDNVR